MMRDTNTLVMQDQGEDLGSVVLSEEQKEAARRLIGRNARADATRTRDQDEIDLLSVCGLIPFEEEQA
jgi:hypothetical protein